MKRTWTIIGVTDVRASFPWYQALFGQTAAAPGHEYWGQICDTDGTVLICLHRWGSHEHPSLMSVDKALPGNGLLLFFRVDDFDLALQRARSLVSPLDEEPHLNPATGTMEFALRDLDGYHVMLSASDASLSHKPPMWTLISNLSWRHPAMLLFYSNVTFGAWALHLERHSQVVVGRGRGLPLLLLLAGLVVLSWSPLYMSARPDAFMPRASLLDLQGREGYKTFVRVCGYVIATVLLAFSVSRLMLLSKSP